jgi:hypothetical protein
VRDHRQRVTTRQRALAATAAIALTLSAGGLVAGSAALAASAPAARADGQASRLITLINGDRLEVGATSAGGVTVAVLPGLTGDRSLLSLQLAGSTYEIPADALPYLNHGLDLDLFNVSYLTRLEPGGRLPLAISYAGRRPSIPGVVITRASGGSAAGYLTPGSARAFGAALARQFRADHQRATYGQDGLFGGQVQLALAGAPASIGPIGPAYRMHTLTVHGRDLRGRRDTGDLIMVFNAANPAIFGGFGDGFSFFYRGAARFSVPAGTYWAVGEFIPSSFNAIHVVVLPQFRVGNAPSASVTISGRAAGSDVTFSTPRPAATEQTVFNVIRTGTHGASFSDSWINQGIALWVNRTTTRPTFGGLQAFSGATMTSPAGRRGRPYTYDLLYQAPDGLIPYQHYVVRPSGLATVTERFYQDPRVQGGWLLFGAFPAQLGLLFGEVVPVQMPSVQTQYLSAGPGILWQAQDQVFPYWNAGGQIESFRTLPARAQLTDDWGEYPLHPQPDVQLLTGKAADLLPQYPSAYRTGNELNLYENAFSDNNPGHAGGYAGNGGSTEHDSYQVYADGFLIARGNPAGGIAPIRVGARPSAIRFVLNAATWGRDYPLSPSTRTVWTWRTAARSGARVPASWYCGFTRSYQVIQRCAIQPLLTLNYQVLGLSLTGRTAPGPQQIDVSVGHLQAAAAAAVTGATAQYSLNDGQSWRRATVTPAGSGLFQLGFDAPAGTDVTLRVSARDAAGGSITETIVRAYGVAL